MLESLYRAERPWPGQLDDALALAPALQRDGHRVVLAGDLLALAQLACGEKTLDDPQLSQTVLDAESR